MNLNKYFANNRYLHCGARLQPDWGGEYILAGVAKKKVVLINLDTGGRYSNEVTVEFPMSVNRFEMEKICGPDDLERWRVKGG